MLTTRVPRFDDSATEFTILISHVGEDFVYVTTKPVPRTMDGAVDRAYVDQLAWTVYCQVHRDRNIIWPNRTPDPYEREIEDSVIPAPSPEEDLAQLAEMRAQAQSLAPGQSPTAAPTEPMFPYRPGDPFGPSLENT